MFLSVVEKGQNNLAFATLFQLGDPVACVDLLIKTQRAPEAALFSRTYAPRFVFLSSLTLMVAPVPDHALHLTARHRKLYKHGKRNSSPRTGRKLQRVSLIRRPNLSFLKRGGRVYWRRKKVGYP